MSLRYYFIVIVTAMLNSLTTFSQNDIDWEKILESNISNKEKSRKLDSIIELNKTKKDNKLERLTHKYAIWLYKKNIDKAISVAKYSLQIKQKHFSSDTLLIQNGYYNIGFFLYKNNQTLESIKYYKKVIELDPTNTYATEAYSELARCYRDKGDYYNAINYFELAQSLAKKHKDYRRFIVNAINASEVHSKLNTPIYLKKGIKNLKVSDSLTRVINSSLTTKYNIKLGLGILYDDDKHINIKKALKYYDHALQIAQKLKDSQKINTVYLSKGNLFNTTNPDRAIQLQKLSLSFISKKDSNLYFSTYANIAYCLANKQNFQESIAYYQKALNIITKKKRPPYFNTKTISQIPNKANVILVLKGLATAYLKQYLITKNPSLLNVSLTTFMEADILLDLMLIESNEFKSKLYWQKQSSELYGRAIEACFLANEKVKAFYFMEKNKASLLSKDLLNNKFKQSLKLPTKLVTQETKLRKQIYVLEEKKKNILNPEEFDKANIEILNKKRRLQTLLDSLKTHVTEYTNFKIQYSIHDLKKVQKSIHNNTVVLEYNISEHTDYGPFSKGYTPIISGSNYGKKDYAKGYLLCITKTDSHFIELDNVNLLKKDIKLFVQLVSKPFKTKEDVKLYTKVAHQIFNCLIPKEISETIKSKKVKIIPDNYLNYIPFEALVTSPLIKNRPKYLIEDCDISYAYSNTFLNHTIRSNENNTPSSFAGFAPINFDKYNLVPLKYSNTEITNINNHFCGDLFTNQDASKKQFLDQLKHRNIIHLATHANAIDSIAPWIAFSDDKLNLDELYFAKTQADLIVLSGCNTLVGKQETGEGVMSLARGFFYAGANSVVSSLWNLDDRSSSRIMNAFYKNLKNRESKSQALRHAKLSYLKNSSLSESSPHFWAPFVLLGNTSPIKNPPNTPLLWLLTLMPLLILFLILYRKFKNK